jgi:ABC-type transport system involved in multi-copper enzyme maturation permease subunit
MKGLLTVVGYTWVEMRRKRIVQAAFLLTLVFLLLLSKVLASVPLHAGIFSGAAGRYSAATGATFVALFLCYGLIAMFSAFTAAGAISGDVESGLLQAVLTRPVSRGTVLLGKWIGHALIEAAYVLLLTGGALLLVHLRFGYPLWSWRLPGAFSLLMLEAWVVSAVAVLASVVLAPLAAGVSVIGLFFLAFLSGMFAQVDFSPGIHGSQPGFLTLNLIVNILFPSDGLYRRAIWEASGGPFGAATLIGDNPIGAYVVPSNPFLLYAVVYVGLMLWAAVSLWRRRDI